MKRNWRDPFRPFRKWGSKGGKTTLARKGKGHFRAISKKGHDAKKRASGSVDGSGARGGRVVGGRVSRKVGRK